MSGRACAFGLYFQYLVSLDFLLDLVADGPVGAGLSVDPSDRDGAGRDFDIVDLDIDHGGSHRAVTVQVKGSIDPQTAGKVAASELAE